MSTTAQLIRGWLAEHGPAPVDQIRAGLPDVNPKTISDLLSRLRARGEVTRDDSGTWATVPADDDTAPVELQEPDAGNEAAAGVLPWLEMLGAEVPGTWCDDSCELGCTRPRWRYTGDHTAIVCPECGPDCWDVSPAAYRRAQAHQGDLRAKSARTGAASVALPQTELDRQAIALNRRKRDVLEAIGWELKRPEVRGDVRHDLIWLLEQYGDARTDERCDELDELLEEIDLPRRPIGQVIRGWLGRGDEDDEGIIDAELVDDDEDQEDDDLPEPEPVRALPAAAAPRRTVRAAVMPRDPIARHAHVVAETRAGGLRLVELNQACENTGRQPTMREIYEAAGLNWGGA